LRSKASAPRVLLDTSFILPTLGIDVGEEILEGLRRLVEVKAEIYYSPLSVLEALWVAARLCKNAAFDEDRFKLGLKSIVESGRYTKIPEKAEVFSEALRLRMLGHMDIIDNILYASSVTFNLKFLSLDTELKRFIQDRGLKDILISPTEISSL